MRGINKILVVVDTRKEQQSALKRAEQISQTTGAVLHILATKPNTDESSMGRLEALALPLLQEGIELYLHETWHKSLIETIIHIRQMERCHMVIKDVSDKETSLKGTLKKALFTPDDWRLLRQCRVPVLLVKTDNPWNNSAMLAAINADPEDHYHSVLNHAILEHARALAEGFTSDLHLATMYPTTMLAIQDKGDGLTDFDLYRKNCMQLGDKFDLHEMNQHIEPGPPETRIPKLARQLGISLLIIGTHARTGLSAMTIGNTAEQLIADVDTDMLILQPKHHMIPLEREMSR